MPQQIIIPAIFDRYCGCGLDSVNNVALFTLPLTRIFWQNVQKLFHVAINRISIRKFTTSTAVSNYFILIRYEMMAIIPNRWWEHLYICAYPNHWVDIVAMAMIKLYKASRYLFRFELIWAQRTREHNLYFAIDERFVGVEAKITAKMNCRIFDIFDLTEDSVQLMFDSV